MDTDSLRNTGLKARSPDGHAARAMSIKGGDVWIVIQEKTFTNWVNEQLRPAGYSVTDLRTDFGDGLKLIALIEILQKRDLKKIRKPLNQHQYLENVQTALNAMAADNIKLVNIGNTDIVEGNLKLILGLVWSLILRYQIGRTNFPPKKLMLAWLQAALPDLKISNFTSDWNSGIALSALLDYCQPGLLPHWRVLKSTNRVDICSDAMKIAKEEFNIPMILTPEDLASPNLDELSGMTYLSYFMREDSPGYKATLRWIQKQLSHLNIKNFTTDWNNGIALCSLVHSFGGNVPGFPKLSTERSQWEQNVQKGISGAISLGVEPLLKAKQLTDTDIEHLGVMAYIARFQSAKPKKHPRDKISITGTDLNKVHVNKPAHFKINILDSNVDLKQIRAEVRSTTGLLEVRLNLSKNSGSGMFVPLEAGMHELTVYCEGEIVSNCPLNIRVHPDISKILFSGIDPCALGSIVEVLINSNGAGGGNVQVEAKSPSGKTKLCPVSENKGSYTATFTPNEIGEWKILVTYSGEHIQGSPFTCYVYDPTQVKVQGLGKMLVNKEHTFTCDASFAGWGEIKIDITHNGRSVPINVDERGNGIYYVSFAPAFIGKYQAQVMFNGIEIKGSPFPIKVVETQKELDSDYNHPSVSISSSTSTPFKGFASAAEFLAKSELNHSNKVGSTENLSFQKRLDISNWSMNSLDRTGRSSSLWDTPKPPPPPVEKKPFSSKLSNASTIDHEELSFHQRAELVNSKLMARSTDQAPKKVLTEAKSWIAKENEASKRDFLKNGRDDVHFPVKIDLENKLRTKSWNSLKNDYPDSLNSPTTSSIGSESLIREETSTNHEFLKSIKKMGSSTSSSNVAIHGEGIKMVAVKHPATFTLRGTDLKLDDISVTVTAPSSREIPVRIDRLSAGFYQIEYITAEVGEHVIDVLISHIPIPDSPFYCSTYDATQIHVGIIPNGTVGKPVKFEIDGADAGSGNLEILVNGGHVTSNVESLGNQRFLASFIPHTASTHAIEMRFNGQEVPGSPWKCEIVEGSKKVILKGLALSSVSVGKPSSFEINAPEQQKENVSVNITGPSKTSIKSKITEIKKDVYSVEYLVFDVGVYSIDVNVAGQKVPGSPFIAKAYDASRIHVYDAPSSVQIKKPCQFQVNASQAGEGQLEISVNEGRVPNQVQVLGNGKCLVSFLPETLSDHVIDIKFNGQNVPGCPILVTVFNEKGNIVVDLKGNDITPIKDPVRFTISGAKRNADLKVLVTGPNGSAYPANIALNPDSSYNVEFLAKEIGTHTLEVENNGTPVAGSPFTVKTYNSQEILVSPMPLATLGKTFQFTVDASHAGEGNLEITVCSRGRNISTQVRPLASAKFGVSFVPNEQHDHIINISFNKEPVPGSPFKVQVGDSGKLAVNGPALVSTAISKLASINIQNGNRQDIDVKIEAPDDGGLVPSTLTDSKDGVKVEFTPIKTGEHKIYVTYLDTPIPGSPFITKVFDIKQIKVKDIPIGVVGSPVTFLVETAHAGPGNLEVMVNNGQVQTIPQAQSPTQYAITFTPKQLRPHYIELKFNGEHIPGSPFQCQVLDVSKVWAKGDGLERVPVQRPAAFHVDTHGVDMGQLEVTVNGPSQHSVKTYINGNPHTGYRVEYTPAEVGDHTVEVKIKGQHVADSPYLVKAYDAGRVKVTDITTGSVGKPVYFGIDASQAGAGNLEIIVSVSGRNVPNYVQSEGNAKFRVNFKPIETHTHTLSVKFNGEPVPGSPFYVKIVEASQAPPSTTSNLRMTSLTKGARFAIDTRGVDASSCKLVVTGPSGRKLPATLSPSAAPFYDVHFTPQEVGPHQVIVTADGHPIAGSPILCNVYDVTKVKVSKFGHALVGVPYTFQVDAIQAGEGTLELVVSANKASLRAEVSMKSRGLYDITFLPQEKTQHFVTMKFNEDVVIGSPFEITVKDSPTKNEVIKHGLVGSVNTLEVEAAGIEGDLEAVVTGPYGSGVPATVIKTERGTYKIEYQSREIGLYKVELMHRGASITTKPFLIEVCDPSRVKVNEVEDGIVNREQSFKVDVARAGRGNLTVNITSGGRDVRHTIKEINSGTFLVTYTPRLDLPHKIDVYYNGHQAPGCPQIVDIRDPGHSIIAHGPGLKAASNNKTSTFLIETGGLGEAKDFDILISAPNGSPLPVKCYLQKDGSLLVEWTPQLTGSHKIEVLYNSKPVTGSPFTCQVFDAKRVSIQKVKTTTFTINERIAFALSRRDAGYAELDVTVTSPLGRHLPIEVKGTPDGEGEVIEFTPTVPGKYKIAITYGGQEVPGSPITFLAQDGGTPKIEGSGLHVAQYGTPTTFKINGKGLWGHPDVRVDGPETEAEVTLEEEDEGVFIVTFVPQEVGIFDVQVLWNSREIPGSPFHPKVVNPQKVRVIGGWENLVDEHNRIALAIGEEKRIPFDVGDAGPGKLKAEVRGPNGMMETHLDQTGSHRYHLAFTPNEEGEYYIYLYFSDIPIPKSPFLAFAEEQGSILDHTRVILKGHGLTNARVSSEAEFIIDGSEAGPGLPEVSLSGVKSDIPVRLHTMGNNVYRATYTPSVPGAYLLNVMWSDRQVKGCPLKVNVTTTSDANKVQCSGEGVKTGTVGKEIKAFIDTRRAGPGELTAHCMGPHKVAYCELYDHRDGTFTLFLKPQEGGRHILTVKYGGEHVPGSPFNVRISGAPDASKVRVYGPGIEPGVLATYQSRFICDTRGAGAGQLTVRIRGPKGAFRVEMQRESQKDRTILCKYDPTEPGDYRLEVKWSGEHVPGSPFMVMIFDTQEELTHYLQGQYHSEPPLPPADYYNGTTERGGGGGGGGTSSMTYGTSYGQMSWRGSTAEL